LSVVEIANLADDTTRLTMARRSRPNADYQPMRREIRESRISPAFSVVWATLQNLDFPRAGG
jgi:hypothetical protein